VIVANYVLTAVANADVRTPRVVAQGRQEMRQDPTALTITWCLPASM
jgi:hypothetical protein